MCIRDRYYSYKIYNNQAGVAGDRSDDYHFGFTNPPETKTTHSMNFMPINQFDLNLNMAVELDEFNNQNVLFVTSTNAGGLSGGVGGDAWDNNIDLTYDMVLGTWAVTGTDWSATRGGPGTVTIDPTLWDYKKISGNTYGWALIADGGTSTDDQGGFQFFQIASTWAPGWITGGLSVGTADGTGSASVMGPSFAPTIIPEPATAMILSIGALFVAVRRRR
jgi:hypothetical protein